MADQGNAALTTALQNIAVILQNIQQAQGANPPPAVPPAPTYATFPTDTPFDLDTRAGSRAFSQMCEPLESKWDGTPQSFAPFLLELRVRSQEVKWDAAAPHGIMSYPHTTGTAPHQVTTNHHLLTNYHELTAPIVEAARLARTDDRAIQNALGLYKCIKHSITGDLHTMMLDQQGHFTANEDGPKLLVHLLSMTTTNSLNMAIQAMTEIQTFDPAAHQYSIPNINTAFKRLFILATTGTRAIPDREKIQHVLTAYKRIKQPDDWARWVQIQTEAFEARNILFCQTFMNDAALKYQSIVSEHAEFKGSANTIRDDIVAMLAKSVASPKRKSSQKPAEDTSKRTKRERTPLPPFAKWYKKTMAPDSPKFAHGDTKEHEGVTFYFCEYPNHRENIRWHPLNCTNCRAWKTWKAEREGSANPPPPAANASTVDDAPPTSAPPPASAASPDVSSAVTAMLAQALSLTAGDDTTYGLIADCLSAIEQA